jgi:periplasmic divalent cation tolerance protein
MKLLAVTTTVATAEAARAMARAIVERRLAACARITPIESLYVWSGTVQNEPEHSILFKTTAAQYPALEAAIRELHTYELPAIHAVAVEAAYGPYAAWVEEGSAGTGR